MVEKVLKIFFTVCKSELLGIVYSSHRIEENASAYSGNGHNRASLCKKPQTPSRIVIYIQNSSKKNRPRISYMLTKKTKCDTMQTIKAKRLNMTSLPFAFCRAKIWHTSVRMEGKS